MLYLLPALITVPALTAPLAPISEPTKPPLVNTVLGTPYGENEVQVTPDGALLAPGPDYLLWMRLYLNSDSGPQPIFSAAQRSIPSPRLSATVHTATKDGLQWRQLAFVSEFAPGQERLFIFLQCKNNSRVFRLLSPNLGFSLLQRGIKGAPKPIDRKVTYHYYAADVGDGRYIESDPRPINVLTGGLPEDWIKWRLEMSREAIEPGETVEWICSYAFYSNSTPSTMIDPQGDLKLTKEAWAEKFKGAAEYSSPEPGWTALKDQLLAQLMVLADRDEMYASPSATSPTIWWQIQALAEWGFADTARDLFDGSRPQDDQKPVEQRDWLDNAIAAALAYRIQSIAPEPVWMKLHTDRMKENANWLLERIAGNPQGILPANTDSGQPFDENAFAWRGIRDTALCLDSVNESGGKEIAEAAAAYRTKIKALFDRRIAGSVPMELGAQTRGESDAYLAAFILEFGAADAGSTLAKDLLKMANGAILGKNAPFGWTMGYQLERLREEDGGGYSKAILDAYARCFDPFFGTSALYGGSPGYDGLEPSGANAAVMLMQMRRMFVYEECDKTDQFNGVLQICPAIPDRWLAQKKPFFIKKLPTAYGSVSVTVTPDSKKVTYQFSWAGKGATPLKSVRLRLPAGSKSAKVVGAKEIGPKNAGWVAFSPAQTVTVTVAK